MHGRTHVHCRGALEYHQEDEDGVANIHFHVGVRAHQFRFLPVKRALLIRHGLACHFSCKHEGYWSVLRYGSVPSPQKPKSALDPKPWLWAHDGDHPLLSESVHEPLTASALRNRRLVKDANAAENGKAPPKISDLDVYPIVVQRGFRNAADFPHAHLELIAYVKAHASTALQAHVWKNRARLPALIDNVWQWETVEDALRCAREHRLDAVRRAAAGACVCEGLWLAAVVDSFMQNAINVKDPCERHLAILGPGKKRNESSHRSCGSQRWRRQVSFFESSCHLV